MAKDKPPKGLIITADKDLIITTEQIQQINNVQSVSLVVATHQGGKIIKVWYGEDVNTIMSFFPKGDVGLFDPRHRLFFSYFDEDGNLINKYILFGVLGHTLSSNIGSSKELGEFIEPYLPKERPRISKKLIEANKARILKESIDANSP